MDIIDVMLAKALSPQGQIDSAAVRAQKAANDAAAAVAAVNEVSSSADTALQKANSVANQVEEALTELENINILTTQDVDNEVDKLAFQLTSQHLNSNYTTNLSITYPSGTITSLNNIIKMYTSLGDNEDGTITQKAITDAINSIEIPQGGSSTTIINLGPENAEKIVIVGPDGNIISSTISQEKLIEALLKSDSYEIENAVSLNIDYENKIFTRGQEATRLNSGEDFNSYSMYGGRMRCNVSDAGEILAFYGDTNYKDDGSNGQVMVYQPKFYYKRVPIKLEDDVKIRSEILIISPEEQVGFKIHPFFKGEDGQINEYALLPAYEGSIFDTSENKYTNDDEVTIDFANDKLSSVSGAKPVTGVLNSLNSLAAEQLANNRGEGWHITNMKAESATQMLMIMEYGSMNAQAAIGAGISTLPSNNTYNNASLTGSTASLGNQSGSAEATINEVNGTITTYTTEGKVAVTYRGQENLWGNRWRFVGDTVIYGDGTMNGGMPYICDNFNYSITGITEDYKGIGFTIPSIYGWVSAMGYGSEEYDWVFMPAECSSANSAIPVGDSLFSSANLNDINATLVGGNASFDQSCGPFFYACDWQDDISARSYGANIMFIPKQNNIYRNNYRKWLNKIGG